MPMCPILRSVDLVLIMYPTPHQYYGAATAYAAPSMGIAVEGIMHPLAWPPGMVDGSHKLAGQVQTHGFRVAQGGHKLGMMVSHLELLPAPDDILTILQCLMSSWEVKFQNGEVTAQGSPLGSHFMLLMNGVVCTDIVSLPVGYSPTAPINDVWHNTSWADVIAGWVEIAVTAVIELALFAADGGFNAAPGPVQSIESTLRDALTPSVGGVAASVGTNTWSSLAGAAVRAVAREHFGYQGAITVQTGGSAGIFGGESLQYTSNADGSWSVQHSETGPLGLTQSDSQYGQDAQGNQSIQRTDRVGAVTAQSSLSEQRQPDGSRQVTEQHQVSESVFGTSQTRSREHTLPATDWL